MSVFTATYSPEDNKLRLYSSSRLDSETYAKVKAAGFSWAPKQGLFVAPMWTPEREDLLIDLAGDIDDEDTSLVDRAEERAERFETYGESRAADAERAHAAVSAIADGIPLGQPILIGHHSERHARRDAEKIENGMRRAVRMWETAKYWERRAAGALSHAKYKELPGVRARRIKGLEADLRKVEKTLDQCSRGSVAWLAVLDEADAAKQYALAMALANHCHMHRCYTLAEFPRNLPASQYEGSMGIWSALGGSEGPEAAIVTPEWAAKWIILELEASKARCERWAAHYRNRIAYEKAMLGESGGLVSDKCKMEPGGKVLRRGEWFIISRVNAGSVSVFGHFAPTIGFDEIKDYRPPTEESAAAVAKVSKLPPLCNYPGEGFRHMTKAELEAEKCRKWSDFPKVGRRNPTEKYGAHRVQQTRGESAFSIVGVYVTDAKRKDPPPPAAPVSFPRERAEVTPRPVAVKPEPAAFDAMRDSLKAGVQVVSANQLFPTPPDLARRLVDLADLNESHSILEPSAGTGNLIRAVREVAPTAVVTAVEVNGGLCDSLSRMANVTLWRSDFLTLNGNLGTFDRIVMNPPFENGDDIRHIQHAREHLKPGGRLVAICANGPRQRDRLMPMADEWIDLEPGSFKASGTNVNAAIVVFTA